MRPTDVRLGVRAKDWRAAVAEAGRVLVESGKVEDRYVDAMIRVVEELGPYMVVARGVALAHARPEAGVLERGLSLVRLKEPVRFGHPDNDPVHLVFGLAAIGGDDHVELMAELAAVLLKGLDAISNAKTAEEMFQAIIFFAKSGDTS
jgi:PTS system ascorbate-specific IIA component